MADFQDFLKWRDRHSADLDLNLAAFRQARDEAIGQSLKEKGVLTLTTRRQMIVLIDDTHENCWERLDTALATWVFMCWPGVRMKAPSVSTTALRPGNQAPGPTGSRGW